MKLYQTKQELREDFERRTDPDGPVVETLGNIMSSMLLGSHIAIRSGINMILSLTEDNDEFPSDRHKEITLRVMSGMKERMRAFELELLNALIDLAWEMNCCECDLCVSAAAEAEVEALRRNAKNN